MFFENVFFVVWFHVPDEKVCLSFLCGEMFLGMDWQVFEKRNRYCYD